MSSEDGGSSIQSYQKQTQTPGSLSGGSHQGNSVTNVGGTSGSTRSKRSSHGQNQSNSHYQQPQQPPPQYKDNLDRNQSACSSYSDHNGEQQLGTNYNSNASPSRYYSSDTYILGNRLSTVSQEK